MSAPSKPSKKKFGGYQFLLGPEQLSFYAGRQVASQLEYLAWQVSMVTKRGGEPWDSSESIRARVNHGRWIADCFWCRTAILTRPEWGVAYCGECGARYHLDQVEFPKQYKAIEKILLRRVRRDQQNWEYPQTVGDLASENELPEVVTP